MTERNTHRRKINASNDSSIQLTTNPTLEAVHSVLETVPFHWAYLQKHAYGQPLIPTLGDLAEMHIAFVLKSMAKSKQFHDKLKISPISGKRTEHYYFGEPRINNTHHTARIYVEKKAAPQESDTQRQYHPLTEYDSMFVAEGLPVILEAKIVNPTRRGSKRNAINSSINQERIDLIFEPLKEYYNPGAFGYIFATTTELISNASPVQRGFKRAGGILLSLPITYPEILSKAEEITLYETQENKK